MRPLKLLTAVDQLVAHLRKEMQEGTMGNSMPGVSALATELGLSPKTAAAALRLLELEGLVSHEGPGRKRRILMTEIPKVGQAKRISILMSEPADTGIGYMVELLHQLTEAGFAVTFACKTLSGLGMNPARIAKFVRRSEADAWVVMAASREVLEWFSTQNIPVFALFGRHQGLPIAGCTLDKIPFLYAVIHNLTQLGHSRIVLINRSRRRLPVPGIFERAFLLELEKYGITTSSYNLPDWKETPEGLEDCLNSLFKISPPTALLFDEAQFFIAAMSFLSRRNLRVPENISIICNDYDPSFGWCHSGVTHLKWETAPLMRRVIRWAANVNRGVHDLGQSELPAKFAPGATVGPVKVSS